MQSPCKPNPNTSTEFGASIYLIRYTLYLDLSYPIRLRLLQSCCKIPYTPLALGNFSLPLPQSWSSSSHWWPWADRGCPLQCPWLSRNCEVLAGLGRHLQRQHRGTSYSNIVTKLNHFIVKALIPYIPQHSHYICSFRQDKKPTSHIW